ncbi:DUF4149 domain-containing protein [Luminiphilus sp.]|jgi:hypothetical protein|nr:DUF4149 domain-containing protein [Halieaceae bacterium]MBT5135879.1 DUF4149 domain-containing protein [Halieaceae bacterium]MBT5556298.1 DUF4149 domain-containing protein [Halieaceae bacterium]MBT6181038.1 DUF4149 domain-containing protein [Halieaceae bacterium]MDC6458936.1 DUF4149 domain-containing protein [Luminiphilus sp.]
MVDIAQALVLLLVGGMLFFPSVVAPVVFASLPEAQAGAFLRAMFPRYYVFMIILSLAAAVMFQLSQGAVVSVEAVLCLSVSVSTFWVRQRLLPRINTARDAQLAGDVKASEAFDRGHKLSVVINIVQLVLLVALIIATS